MAKFFDNLLNGYEKLTEKSLFQDYFGYRRFFMIVSALAILAFVAATVSYLISKKDKDTHCGPVF